MMDELAKRDTIVIAISQEGTDLAEEATFIKKGFEGGPRFEIGFDLNRSQTEAFDRTTAYLIDKQGVVRQIFPMTAYNRPSWWALLGSIDELNKSE